MVTSTFGIQLLLYVILALVAAFRASHQRRGIFFFGLHLASLVFVLSFLSLHWPGTEAKFVALGQYYTLSSLTSSPADGVGLQLSVGDKAHQPDYVLDGDCKKTPCFDGQIIFTYEQAPKHRLSWETSELVGAQFRLLPVHSGWFAGLRNALGWGGVSDGKTGVPIAASASHWRAEWIPAKDSGRAAIRFDLIIENDPSDAPPRWRIEPQETTITELPNTRNYPTKPMPLIHLSSRLVGAMQNPPTTAHNVASGSGADVAGYVPIVTVGRADPVTQVNAFLQLVGTQLSMPATPAENQGNQPTVNSASVDFIVNNGLTRNGYLFGQRCYVGGERGVIGTVLPVIGPARWQMIVIVGLLWLLPLVLYLPLFPWRAAQAGRNLGVSSVEPRLGVMLATIQMLLAVRFVLGLRAFLWSPYSSESLEGAILAALLIPLLVFMGCFARGLKDIGDARDRDPERPSWWKYLSFGYPPMIYYLLALTTLIVIAFMLQAAASGGASKLPGLWDWAKDFLLLSLLPLALWLVALNLDLRQRQARDTYRDTYEDRNDDPFTYFLTRPWPEALAGQPSQQRLWWLALRAVILVALLAIFFSALRWSWKLIGGTVAAGAVPLLGVRTNLIFELLILCLTMRLLVAFFRNWAQVEDSYGRTGIIDLLVIFLAPVVMFCVSFLLASKDYGALAVQWPALLLATLLVTGLWPLWKYRKSTDTWAALLIAFGVFVLVFFVLLRGVLFSEVAVTLTPQSRTTHRIILREGLLTATRQTDVGGTALVGAIEQHWRMLNYAAEGKWLGVGYGYAPLVPPGRKTFQAITLSDLVFATYVLAEHGAFGGIMLLLLYLLLFLLVMWIAWERLRDEPLRLTLAGALVLMRVFPAFYMAGANVNQMLFTGQDLPLLGLRSRSDLLRCGLVLLLLLATLRPLNGETVRHGGQDETAGWWYWVRQSLRVLFSHRARNQQWQSLPSGLPRTHAVVAINLFIFGLLLLFPLGVALRGILSTSDNAEYKQPLDLTWLKARARERIERGHIWFEPLVPNSTAGSLECRGSEFRNRPADSALVPTQAYQLCIDRAVRGGEDGATLAQSVAAWNKRTTARGDWLEEKNDEAQFFRLNLTEIARNTRSAAQADVPASEPASRALTVHPGIYRFTSPFQPLAGWRGDLLEASSVVRENEGGVLIGAQIALPLRAAHSSPGMPAKSSPYVGANEHVLVRLDQPTSYEPARGFRVTIPPSRQHTAPLQIFEIETVRDAAGALLRPLAGDFDLYLNGCPLRVGDDSGCYPPTPGVRPGTVPPIRLDYGDVIAYAPRRRGNKPVAQYVFIYNRAKLGAFSYLAWVNGREQRVYPQGEQLALAEQITGSLSNLGLPSEHARKEVYLTLDGELNRKVNELLGQWRARLDKNKQSKLRKNCSWRRMSVTLMDAETGNLLTLADNHGEIFNPDAAHPCTEQKLEANLNFVSHRIGSAVKPFTAAATLKNFPGLTALTLDDQRSNPQKLFGKPFGGENGLQGHSSVNTIPWENFRHVS